MKQRLMSFITVIIVLFTSLSVLAAEDIYKDVENVELQENAGLTPDSPFYFIDEKIENFLVGDDPEKALAYKEEKIAEALQMIEEGKTQEAKAALNSAQEFGNIIEKEVSPEIEKRARESSKAVKKVVGDIQDNLEGEKWDEIREILQEQNDQSDKIALAATISKKIQTLCESLADLDPKQYADTCQTGDDAPRWQQRLDKKLTAEQREEAEEFFGIMSSCFKNPRECPCEKIKIKSFSEKCSEIAPLAAQCEDGDEDACERMDQIEDPIKLLPPHLQEVMNDIEGQYGEAQYDLHMPKECVQAKATSPKECMKIMFMEHSPPECKEALEQGKISFENEQEARRACEKIMFAVNAPPECVQAVEDGKIDFSNPREAGKACEKIMFESNAPKECINAGITGEDPRDPERCREVMHEMGAMQGPMQGERGSSPMPDCRRIEDAEERLKCYDNALTGFGGEGPPMDHEPNPENFPPPCREAKAIDRESCEKIMREWGENQRNQEGEGQGEGRNNHWPEPCARAQAFDRDSCDNIMRNMQPSDNERVPPPMPPPDGMMPSPNQGNFPSPPDGIPPEHREGENQESDSSGSPRFVDERESSEPTDRSSEPSDGSSGEPASDSSGSDSGGSSESSEGSGSSGDSSSSSGSSSSSNSGSSSSSDSAGTSSGDSVTGSAIREIPQRDSDNILTKIKEFFLHPPQPGKRVWKHNKF